MFISLKSQWASENEGRDPIVDASQREKRGERGRERVLKLPVWVGMEEGSVIIAVNFPG